MRRTTQNSIGACVVLAALACVAAPARADTLDDTFRAANEAYARGAFAEAATGYERLVELGVSDPDVFFDLGVSYARAGRHGRAVAAFERGLRLAPGDAGLVTALDTSRGVLGRRRAEREGEALVDSGPPLGESLFGWAGQDTLAVAVLALEIVFFGSLLALLFLRRESTRVAVGITAPLAALLCIALGFGLASRSGALDPGPAAIVVRDGAPLREGPSTEAGERHRALEGERVHILSTDREFARVIGSDGREGWMAAGDLVEL